MASFLHKAIVDTITLLENDAVFSTPTHLVAAEGRAKSSVPLWCKIPSRRSARIREIRGGFLLSTDRALIPPCVNRR